METGVIKGPSTDPSVQILPTLGLKVCKDYLHWAIWIPISPYKLLVAISCSICFPFDSQLLGQYLGLVGSLEKTLNPKLVQLLGLHAGLHGQCAFDV